MEKYSFDEQLMVYIQIVFVAEVKHIPVNVRERMEIVDVRLILA
jgi:hypothetical protein